MGRILCPGIVEEVGL